MISNKELNIFLPQIEIKKPPKWLVNIWAKWKSYPPVP